MGGMMSGHPFVSLGTVMGMGRRHTMAVPFVEGLLEWLKSQASETVHTEGEEVFRCEDEGRVRAGEGKLVIVQVSDIVAPTMLDPSAVLDLGLWQRGTAMERLLLAVPGNAHDFAYDLIEWLKGHGRTFWGTNASTCFGCRWAVELHPGDRLVLIEVEISEQEHQEEAAHVASMLSA